MNSIYSAIAKYFKTYKMIKSDKYFEMEAGMCKILFLYVDL